MDNMKAIKMQIYPTKEQAILIDKTIGCSRFVYNNALAFKILQYEKDGTTVSKYDLTKRLTEQKKEFEWLKEVECMALQQSLLDLDSAYINFFRDKKGFPKFHKKGQKDSYRTLRAKKESKHKLYLPKIGAILTAEPIKKKWIIKNVTISKRAGKYFISMLIKYTHPKKQKTGEMVGIDVGIKTFATLSNGIVVNNIKTTAKYAEKLALLQRRFSHTQKGSNNRNKARLAVARLHLKIANTRQDFLHKTSTVIAKQYSFVALENLNIGGMIKNHKLAKSICDCSWSEFIRQLEYKGKWYDCKIRKIGRFEPSSKLCGECGYKIAELPLNIREWDCPNCNTHHDRDLNAARNILKIALSGREEEPVDTRHNGVVEQENLKVAE